MRLRGYGLLAALLYASSAAAADVVEFYNAGLDHYFISWVPAEIANLDSGNTKGWKRTGRSFSSFDAGAAGVSPVCRFYIPPALGDSHFYGRGVAECDSTASRNPGFVAEDPAFMSMVLPSGASCPQGSIPVYRVFSNRKDANHRYTTDRAIRDEMVSRGWLAEGDGPDLVVMCAAAPSRRDAARFLRQATFGANRTDLAALSTNGYAGWIDEQVALPATSHVATTKADPNFVDKPWDVTMPSIWKQFFEARDQLRQRVGFALSQIFVVSMNNNVVQDAHCGVSTYVDMLNRHAFGNFRSLLREVTLSAVMGEYLSMKGSAKADPVLQTQPDENFAREVMQLFSVGLVMLDPDGSPVLGADGVAVPAFDEDTVKGMAKALSGWTFGTLDQSKPWQWLYPDIYDANQAILAQKSCAAWSARMKPWTQDYRSADDTRTITGPAHDTSAKQLLKYPRAAKSSLPPNQSAETDLEDVVDNLFNHPNVGPFIGKQLIQRLVTSNPSAAYIRRVAATFDDNGRGVRGDMSAVVRAILLDDEARSVAAASQPSFGKLTEPVVRFVQFYRAFNARSATGYYEFWDFGSPTVLNQNPMRAPSVFNFYRPDFVPAGPLSDSGLVGPEFEIATASAVAGFSDFSKWGMVDGLRLFRDDVEVNAVKPDYSEYLALIGTPAALVDELDLVLCGASMQPALKQRLATSIGKVEWPVDPKERALQSLQMVVWLMVNSPDCMVQK